MPTFLPPKFLLNHHTIALLVKMDKNKCPILEHQFAVLGQEIKTPILD